MKASQHILPHSLVENRLFHPEFPYSELTLRLSAPASYKGGGLYKLRRVFFGNLEDVGVWSAWIREQ